MASQVDDLDRDIVRFLTKDGRLPATVIARSLPNASPRTVSLRIHRLIERGIIRVTGAANPKALGYGLAANIAVEVEPRMVRDVAAALLLIDEVSYVAIIAGDRDLDVHAVAFDMDDLTHFVTERLQIIPGVRRTETCLIMNVLKTPCEWGIPSPGASMSERGGPAEVVS